MKTKSVITVILLIFVGISIVTLILKENNSRKQIANTALGTDSENARTADQTTLKTKIIVYYFHNTTRCRTCRKIEALTIEAIETGFPEELKSGTIKLQMLNVEEPINEHFVLDYQLTASAVVVSLLKNGSEINWKRLDKVWEFVGDETTFISYIQDETRPLLMGEN